MDLDKLGVFSHPGSIHVGDAYKAKKEHNPRETGKQFLTGGPAKTGRGPDAYLDKTLKRLTEGDPYVDPATRTRQEHLEQKKTYTNTKPFVLGGRQGSTYKPPEYVSVPDKDADKPKSPKSPGPRNFVTSPSKSGRAGLLGKEYPYMSEPYDSVAAMDKKLREQHRETLKGKTFVTANKSGSYLFDNSTAAFHVEPGPLYVKPKTPKVELKPFRPSSPSKKGYNAAPIIPFMEPTPEQKAIEAARKEKEKEEMERRKKLGVFWPAKGPKSTPIRVVRSLPNSPAHGSRPDAPFSPT
eukprot:jgi/Mesvir1/21914/Mv01973-RA.1